uniref:Uncharacterized protein LOC100175592 n=1 Tax=Phallusia mammillata TaxID=59560 RepID=A0A6F9DH07_9ASCI|nr:uncharacterized protein LOC100175592 [Phallusia mammillata]
MSEIPHEANNTATRDEFNPPKLYHVRVIRLGFIHLLLGVFTLCIGIFDIAFSAVAYDVFSQAKAATGIWVGAVIIITGMIGLVTSRSKLRRRTTILLFGGLSVACVLVCMILIGISISEMVTSSFAKGELSVQGTNCTIDVTSVTTPTVRCIAQTTFEQKLATTSLLIIFGFFESLVAVISAMTTRDIFVTKYTENLQQNAPDMNMSVTDYFDRRMNEEPNTIYNGAYDIQGDTDRPFHIGTGSELPDSDQFRSHLEGVGDRNYGSTY